MTLGQRVRFTHVLQRNRDLDGTVTWDKVSCGEREGVLVGFRTLKLGNIVTESDYDEFWGRSYTWNEFRQTGRVRAALIATNLYQNPIHVPREEVDATN